MKRFFFAIAVISTIGGGYALYEYWFKYRQQSLWSFVPENAVMVYENSEIIASWDALKEISVWKTLSQLESLQKVDDHLVYLDSLAGGEGALEKIIDGNKVLISLHIVSQSNFDFLYQTEIKDVESHTTFWKVINKLEGSGYHTSTRSYLGHKLTEIRKDNEIFTYILLQNFFIGSFTPYLVEDVIRTFDDTENPSFEEQHQGLFSMVKLQNDFGNLYLNAGKAQDLLDLFTQPEPQDKNPFKHLAKSTFVDVSLNDTNILFNGFSLTEKDQRSFLNTFQENPSTPFQIGNLIPTTTAFLLHLTATNMNQWGLRLKAYHQTNYPGIIEQYEEIKSKYDFDIDQFYPLLGTEIALSVLESRNSDGQDKILFISLKDPDQTSRLIGRLSEISVPLGDSLFVENYEDIRITQLNTAALPQLLFGPYFTEFEQNYFTEFGQHLIIGNSIEAIKKWYESYQNDNTWGKSVQTNNFLEGTLKEANLSLFVNTNRSWNELRNKASEEWLRFFEEKSGVFKRFEMAAFQFSYIDNKFYTSMIFHQPEATSSISGYKELQNLKLASQLVTKPYIVRNHNDRSLEIMIQDSLLNLYLIDAEMKVIWSDSILGKINSDIIQIDYYKNGKLQYLFSTRKHLHLIDRNGNYLPGYPLSLGEDINAEYLALVDYDKTKRYRFMVTDTEGNLFLYDKNGKNLEGWTPKGLTGPLTYSAFHSRIRTRDRMIAIQKNGIANVISRTGKTSAGFPLDLKAKLNGPAYFKVGSDFKTTSLTLITVDGEVLQFNLLGQVLKRKQLYKPDIETTFATLPDALGQSYVFVRQTKNKIDFMDGEGNLLFGKDYLSSQDLEWQYYDFGGDKQIIIVLDKQQQLAYLYNLQGVLINYQPIESGASVALLYFSGENIFRLYRSFDTEVSQLEFSY